MALPYVRNHSFEPLLDFLEGFALTERGDEALKRHIDQAQKGGQTEKYESISPRRARQGGARGRVARRGCGPIKVIGVKDVVGRVTAVAASKQYRDNAALVAMKVLEAAGALNLSLSEREERSVDGSEPPEPEPDADAAAAPVPIEPPHVHRDVR